MSAVSTALEPYCFSSFTCFCSQFCGSSYLIHTRGIDPRFGDGLSVPCVGIFGFHHIYCHGLLALCIICDGELRAEAAIASLADSNGVGAVGGCVGAIAIVCDSRTDADRGSLYINYGPHDEIFYRRQLQPNVRYGTEVGLVGHCGKVG